MYELDDLLIREIFEGDYELVQDQDSTWGNVYQLSRVLDRQIQEVYIEFWNYYDHLRLEDQPLDYVGDVHVQYGEIEPTHLYFSVYSDREKELYICDIQTNMNLKQGVIEEGMPCPIRIEALLRAIRLQFQHQRPLITPDYSSPSVILW